MQEKDFEKLNFEKKPEECEHKIVEGLYELGAQDGYGCLQCGKRAQRKSDFHKN